MCLQSKLRWACLIKGNSYHPCSRDLVGFSSAILGLRQVDFSMDTMASSSLLVMFVVKALTSVRFNVTKDAEAEWDLRPLEMANEESSKGAEV